MPRPRISPSRSSLTRRETAAALLLVIVIGVAPAVGAWREGCEPTSIRQAEFVDAVRVMHPVPARAAAVRAGQLDGARAQSRRPLSVDQHRWPAPRAPDRV